VAALVGLLRRIYEPAGVSVPAPVAHAVTKWECDRTYAAPGGRGHKARLSLAILVASCRPYRVCHQGPDQPPPPPPARPNRTSLVPRCSLHRRRRVRVRALLLRGRRCRRASGAHGGWHARWLRGR
jgi:hypothetical protein